MKRLVRKVPGGKLLKVDVEVDGGVIRRMEIHGDFFMHPEESVNFLESLFIGRPVASIDSKEIVRQLDLMGVVIVGFSIKDIMELLGDAA